MKKKENLLLHDLMICDGNDNQPMCIAGVFGGLNSGIKNHKLLIYF
jgi:phenylalanyl-tRNA synthetase beta chain